MKNKVAIMLLVLIVIISACKKSSNANVDPRIMANYLFKTSTYWVYSDYVSYTDSMYVAGTGTRGGYPYMQINETIKNFNTNAVVTSFTTYIGAGPKSTELQQWGYDLINNTTNSQVIFDLDTPAYVGSYVATGCIYASGAGGPSQYTTVDGVSFNSNLIIGYAINYNEPNQNQYYGQTSLGFYSNYGIISKYSYNTAVGNLFGYLVSFHIAQ